MEEIWKDIPDFEYQVSNYWRIKSLDKITLQKNQWWWITKYHKKWKILKCWSKHHNYQCIYLCKDWIRNVRMVHRLVAQVFLWLWNSDSKIEVWHKDNNPGNNNINNLYLTTHRANEDYKMLCWRTTFWERSTSATLTEIQVIDIYKKYKSWTKVADLQREYLHWGIYEIIKWVTWKHLYHHFNEYEHKTTARDEE